MDKYFPTYKEKAFNLIDFNKYYRNGYKIILTDLDNTITTYDKNDADKELILKFKEIKRIGFKIIIVSNSPDKRVKRYASSLDCTYIPLANKPSVKKVKSLLDLKDKDEMIMIGDQMLTDILFANKLGIDSILVDSISLNVQKWYTKINRLREKYIMHYAKKHNYEKYKLIRGEKDE